MTQSLRTHRKSTDKEANEMASSNDIEVLDPTASVEKLKNIVSKVALNRRHFMAALGAAGVAAGTGLVSRPDAHAQQPTPNGFLQVDVLNFLLNIKYLKATFYSYLTQGDDLPDSTYVTLGSNQIYSTPPKLTGLSSQVTDMFSEMYYDELNQLVDLRNILGSAAVNRPCMNLAGTSAANTTFSAPAATMSLTGVQAIAQARMLEDVSVTAFAGALTYLTGTNLAFAAQILAVDGCHAAALRLASIQNPAVLYQGSLYQSSFPASTTPGSNTLYAQLASTKAVVGDIITGIGIPVGSVITAITPSPNVTFAGIMSSASGAASTITAVTGISGGLSITNLAAGQPITGTSLTANNYILSQPSGTTITLGLAAKVTPTAVFPTGYVTSGSNTITSVSSVSALTIGQGITGPGIQSGTIISGTASGTGVPTTITLSKAANTTPMVLFTGVVTSGSNSITPVASTAGLAVGQTVTGTGIPLNTYITNIGSNISMGSSPTGPAVNATLSSVSTTITTFNGILTSGKTGITNVPSIAGLALGQPLTAGTGIPVGTTITAMSGTTGAYTITMSQSANASSTVSTTGTITSGSKIVTNVQSLSGMILNQSVTGSTGIPATTTITAITPAAGATAASITMSNAASLTPVTITFSAITTAGSNQLTNVVTAINGSSLSGLVVGQPIIGPGIPTGTVITFLGTVAPFTVGMSQAATVTFTPASFLCDMTSGQSNLVNVSSIDGLAPGQCIYISGAGTTGIPNNTVILKITPNTITELGNIITMGSATTWTGTTGSAVTALTTFSNGATITTAQILTSPAQITLTTPALSPIFSGGSVLSTPALSTFSTPAALTFTVGQGSITISQPATGSTGAVITATIATSDPAEVVPFDPGTAALAAAGPVIDPTSTPAVYQGFFATPGSHNASSTTPAGFAYARTFSQVLAVLYANNATSIYEGGFFPIGVAGNINVV
jgi:hypothetical protein